MKTNKTDIQENVTPHHPVFVNRFDRSMFLANSLALRLAGIDERTPNPKGGVFEKDAQGRLTGIVRGSAVDLVRKAIPPISMCAAARAVRAVLKEAREGGITTMQDLTLPEQLRAYQMLKASGELTARILKHVAADPAFALTLAASTDVLGLIEEPTTAASGRRGAARAKSDVDHVITLPKTWFNKPHRDRLRYFIPEWDDLVDRDYDFEHDVHFRGSGNWANEVYAHQLYPEPNYDGILISKVVAEKSKSKKERINRLGVHRFLRVPREFPVMGYCGAFGYINEKVPPYTTGEILDYYTRLDFDFGVSLDHLIVALRRRGVFTAAVRSCATLGAVIFVDADRAFRRLDFSESVV